MPIVECKCCDTCSVRRTAFGGCCGGQNRKRRDEVLYTDHIQQIAVMATPDIDFPALLVFPNLEQTDIYTIARDPDKEIRFVTFHGAHTFHGAAENLRIPQDIIGQKVEDVLPDYASRFLYPIYEYLLNGNLYQIMIMWSGTTFLFRTFPIRDHRKRIIAGMVVMAPFTSEFNGDINRFALNAPTSSSNKINQLRVVRNSGILSSLPHVTDVNTPMTETMT